MSRNDWTYQQYKERLDAYLRKCSQRKVLKARRMEHEQIKQAGGGAALAAAILKPCREKGSTK